MFAVSEQNTNAKIKRWKAFIEEENAKVFYKPGKKIVWPMPSRQCKISPNPMLPLCKAKSP